MAPITRRQLGRLALLLAPAARSLRAAASLDDVLREASNNAPSP